MNPTNTDQIDDQNVSEERQNNEIEKETANSQTSATTTDVPAFGWSSYAERVNGRFAMIGFTAVLLIEAFSKQGFLQWAGLIQ